MNTARIIKARADFNRHGGTRCWSARHRYCSAPPQATTSPPEKPLRRTARSASQLAVILRDAVVFLPESSSHVKTISPDAGTLK